MSTVTPSESASAVTGKKNKPGKAERAARRSAVQSEAGAPASQSNAMVFANSVVLPTPQPGKYPVIFQVGAGEPSRDVQYVIDPMVLATSVDSFVPAFKENPKYAEFLAHTEYTDEHFRQQLSSAALLRLAQQVVHCHVNMGLPQGDFAPVSSTEVRVPNSVNAFVSEHGEFAVPVLGTRFLYHDYPAVVRSLVWAARNASAEKRVDHVIERSWLPVKTGDKRSAAYLGAKLNQFLEGAEIHFLPGVLETAVYSGDEPAAWDDVKGLLGTDATSQGRFDFLFRSYADAPTFVTTFTTAVNLAALRELGVAWPNPSAGHVDWNFNVKEWFTQLSDEWAQKSAAYAQFFELSSSQTNRSAASGSQAQLANVNTIDTVSVMKTHLALSAPEFSLVACFPASCLFTSGLTRNVVVTTPLSVRQRRTEFIQMDWR